MKFANKWTDIEPINLSTVIQITNYSFFSYLYVLALKLKCFICNIHTW